MAARGVRLVAAALGALAALAVLASGPPAAAQAADAPSPAQWPQTPSASPRIEGFPHALRIAGPDRQQTSLAAALTLRGTGGFPFTTPDRSSGGAATLAQASGWWGVGVCPRAVIVVAGDSPADALAASALSDPTDRSSEPFLQRTAAADPLFDPIGGFTRVDTDSAPILVTRSARQGATALSVATRIAAQDLAQGGCFTARQAIVVGGTAAVPTAVEAELVSIGYAEVFRVAGANRYATAAAVARSLGTDAPSTAVSCLDPVTSDGTARLGWYANATIELRASPTDCRVLGRTVVLADGITGADALAAGWWTSFWQVPVLLHDGSTRLPADTVAAFETLDVDHLVVLGGTGRIAPAVVAQAVDLTGAEAVRISGADRYATSVEMAQRLGGWWPTGDGADAQASLVCLAASSGEGPSARGWPDALGAGPWCGAASGAAANPGAPLRALAPTTGAAPRTSAGGPDRPARDAVPVLLVPAGAAALPAPVAALLAGAFRSNDAWCSSVATVARCLTPGFAVGFGGSAVVSDSVLDAASRLMSGGAATSTDARSPRLDGAFHTVLDLGPVFGGSGPGPDRICVARNAGAGARWIAVFGDAAAARLLRSTDVMLDGSYRRDADSIVRSPGVLAPSCVSFAATAPDATATARAVGLTGATGPRASFALGVGRRFELAGPVLDSSVDGSSGIASQLDPDVGGVTTWTFLAGAGPAVTSRGVSSRVVSSAITITLRRGVDGPGISGPDRFDASWSLTTPLGTVTGTAAGEAVLDGSTWRLRGSAVFSGGSWNVSGGRGGFVADIATAGPGSGDDAVSWQLDGLVDG